MSINHHKPYCLIRLDSLQDVFCGSYYCTASQVPTRISTRTRRKQFTFSCEMKLPYVQTTCAPKCSSFGFKKTWIGRIHEFSNSMELSLYLLPTFDVPPICTMATEMPGWHLQRAQKQRRGLLPPPQTFGRPECRGKEWRFDLPANHFPRLGCLGHQIWNLAGTETLDTLYPIHIYTLNSFG